jgi:hypothetical protein
VQFARDGDWERYDRTRSGALAGGAADAARGFPSTADHWLWAWIAKVLEFDPMPHWQRMSLPVFFAYGETDEEDNVPVGASVSRIRAELAPERDVTVQVYPGSGHALYDPVLAEEGEGVIRDDFADDLAAWIESRVSSTSVGK